MYRHPEDRLLALECLKLAMGCNTPVTSAQIVAAAGDFMTFVLTDNEVTPREQIIAALDAANVR